MRIGFTGGPAVARRRRPEFARPGHGVPADTLDKGATELACRRGAGIEVTLRWDRTDGELTVSVAGATANASFELPVAPDEALMAFYHPYAYAAFKGVAY